MSFPFRLKPLFLSDFAALLLAGGGFVRGENADAKKPELPWKMTGCTADGLARIDVGGK